MLIGIVIILLIIYSITNTEVSAKPSPLPVQLGKESEIESFVPDLLVAESNKIESSGELSVHAVKALEIIQYKVMKGDSLSSIAKKFGINIDTIISYNNIKTVRSIVPDLALRIPSSNGIKHMVKTGDCLSCIAAKYKTPLNNILDYNDITSDTIKIGASLFIPGARMSKAELNKVLGTLFVWPVKGLISSPYGYRVHPIDSTKSFHNGLDISGTKGTPIKAAMAGKVAKIGINFLYGNYVIISHDDGFQTLYGHLSGVSCKEGKYIEQGSEVGKMGNTGYSTGDHLHFSIFKKGDTVDPRLYLK
jgi:murein DD-endopeptidase MepM/ murein hydrolase activator NlpD